MAVRTPKDPRVAVGTPDPASAPPSSVTRPSSRFATVPDLCDGGPFEKTARTRVEPVADSFANMPLPKGTAAHLDVVRSVNALDSYSLRTIRTVIGRGPDVNLYVNDQKVSRKHASIIYTGREFRIRDESSINGTVLNGSKVVEYVIRDGDSLLIGDTLFRFCVAPPG